MSYDATGFEIRIGEHRRKASECRRLAKNAQANNASWLLAHAIVHEHLAQELEVEGSKDS